MHESRSASIAMLIVALAALIVALATLIVAVTAVIAMLRLTDFVGGVGIQAAVPTPTLTDGLTPTLALTATPTPTPSPNVGISITCPAADGVLPYNAQGAASDPNRSWTYTLGGWIAPTDAVLPPNARLYVIYHRPNHPASPNDWTLAGSGTLFPDGGWMAQGWIGDTAYPPIDGEIIEAAVALMDPANAVDGAVRPNLGDFTAYSFSYPVRLPLKPFAQGDMTCSGPLPPETAASAPETAWQPTAFDAAAWQDLCWVSYGPTHQNPLTSPALIPSSDSILEDLRVLHAAGFDGLITYSAYGDLHTLAEQAGFQGVILGVNLVRMATDRINPQEVEVAIDAAESPIVWGYAIGNEGLHNETYTLDELRAFMQTVAQQTGRPVATNEDVRYYTPELLALGDWIFPGVHPYHVGYTDPAGAAAWTAQQYADLVALAGGRPVFFREVGLPSGGEPDLSPEGQAAYYQALAQTPVFFSYFEAFDQPWKDWSPVEPYWGLFDAQRSPKPVVEFVCPRPS